jgi:hypothetical protein
VRDVCVKVGKELASDLYQELFLILCEKEDKWIEDKYASGYWEGYIIRIIFNQYYGKYTNFAKNYLNPIGLEDTDEIELPADDYDISTDLMQLCVDRVVSELDWYHQTIWTLYRDGDETKSIAQMNARSLNRSTGISRHEIWRVIKLVKEKANELYNEKYGKYFD